MILDLHITRLSNEIFFYRIIIYTIGNKPQNEIR